MGCGSRGWGHVDPVQVQVKATWPVSKTGMVRVMPLPVTYLANPTCLPPPNGITIETDAFNPTANITPIQVIYKPNTLMRWGVIVFILLTCIVSYHTVAYILITNLQVTIETYIPFPCLPWYHFQSALQFSCKFHRSLCFLWHKIIQLS